MLRGRCGLNIMTILIDAALLCLVLLLVYPKPLHETIKRAAPALMVIGAVFCAMLVLQTNGERTITVTALDQRNEAAEGSEIVLTGIVVDGESYQAADIFSEGWINEGGRLRWRSYDQPSDMRNAVSAVLPAGAEVDILFETNKWRDRIQVQEGNLFSIVYQVDCYSGISEEGHTLSYLSARHLSGIRVPGKVLLLCLLGLLASMAAVCSALREEKRRRGLEGGKNREIWLDVLKVCSAPLVVLIHTVGAPYANTQVGSAPWIGYLVLNTVPRCAVPIFIMVSGILLIGREYSAAKVWRNVRKALILLVVWNVVYIFVQALLWGPSESILRQILSLPVKRGPSGHLWYAHFLVWLYLFAPIVSAVYRALTNAQRIYFVLLTVGIPGLLDLYLKLLDINVSSTLYAFQLYMTLTYIGIMFAGRLIYENAESVKRLGLVSLWAVVIGLGGTLAITNIYSNAHQAATDKFLSETQLLAVCYACGLVGVAAKYRKVLENLPKTAKRAIERLSRYSVGIYFIHTFNIWTVGSIQMGGLRLSVYDGVIQTLILCMIYYLLSVVEVSLMARIPALRKLVT